jgi:CRP-like cAMP-binding protein
MTARSFAERLCSLASLSDEDVASIQAMPWSVVRVRRARDILSLGDRPDYVYVVETGWAARYSIRGNGSRRITGFMLPGDFCGIHAVTSQAMDHAIVALTDCEVARIPRQAIGQALWRAKLTDEAILRTWLLNSHDAAQALAHLLCELHARTAVIGMANAGRFHAPLTQQHMGDALGLTPVHINRMVKLLRLQGLAEISNGEVVVPDIEALRHFCHFSADYLHLPAIGTQHIAQAAA